MYTFELFEPQKDTNHFTELFEIPIHEDIIIIDLKRLVAQRLEETHKNLLTKSNADGISLDPSCIRLRELPSSITTKKVGKAFVDHVTLKKSHYYAKRFAVQLLPEPETGITDKHLFIFVQLFKPSSFELTRKEDFATHEDTPTHEFKAALAKKFDIEEKNLCIAKVENFYSFYDDPELLDVPKLKWNPELSPFSSRNNSVMDALFLRNGSLVIVRDHSEKLKELSKEERDAIEKESRKKMMQNNTSSTTHWMSHKEKALKIQTSD